MRLLAAFIIVCLLTTPGISLNNSQPGFTGAKLYSACNGVVTSSKYSTSLCFGYVRGMSDEILIGNNVCVKNDVDIKRVTQKFLTVYKRGDLWVHHAASTFLHEAINELYPCHN